MAFVKGKNLFGKTRCKECHQRFDKIQRNQEYCSIKCRQRHHDAGGMSFERQARLIRRLVREEFAKQRGALLADMISRLREAQEPTELAAQALEAALHKLRP